MNTVSRLRWRIAGIRRRTTIATINPLMDPGWYRRHSHGAMQFPGDPRLHYVLWGAGEGCRPHPLFDPHWYLTRDPDLTDDPSATTNPLLHALDHPTRSPHELFDSAWYLTRYPDVAAAGEHPLVHYLTTGASEGRMPNHWLSPDHYARWFPRCGWVLQNPAADIQLRRSGEFVAASRSAFRADVEQHLEEFLTLGERLDLTDAATAQVTVVIPAFNQAALLLRCLESLADCEVPLYVIVVDDCSTDLVPSVLAQVDGITVITNECNIGFVDSANRGTAAVRTPLTLLLNSDAIVRVGSLSAALRVFEEETDVAAVGARVIHPTGLLQEAGSIVWRNGNTVGFLRGMPPDYGAGMYRREVDYASGVALLMRSDAVLEMSGFATEFRPAYYEEVDLCARLWQAGERIVYEPAFVVDHLEFGSATPKAEPGKLMIEHRSIFRDRHRAWLSNKPREGQVPVSAMSRWRDSVGGRVLVVDDRPPHGPNGSGDPRGVALLNALADLGVQATLMPTNGQPVNWGQVWEELPRSLEIRSEPGVTGIPWVLEEYPNHFDVLLVSRIHNLDAVLRLRRDYNSLRRLRLVYDSEAITSLARDPIPTAQDPDGTSDFDREMHLARQADHVIAVSPYEAALFTENGCPDVHVLSHHVEVGACARRDAPPSPELLFVGRLVETDSPNVRSLRWFLQSVLPIIRRAVPAARLTVVGKISRDIDHELSADGVRILGAQDDLAPHFASSRVFVAPTLAAAGIPIKVITAAAWGTPTVCTPILARQLGWSNGREVLVGADSEAFADAVVTLIGDETVWRSVRDAALERVAQDHSQAAFESALSRILSVARDIPQR